MTPPEFLTSERESVWLETAGPLNYPLPVAPAFPSEKNTPGSTWKKRDSVAIVLRPMGRLPLRISDSLGNLVFSWRRFDGATALYEG